VRWGVTGHDAKGRSIQIFSVIADRGESGSEATSQRRGLEIARTPVVTQRNPAPSLSSPPTAPSIHVRAALTWLAISPLAAIGLTATVPFTVGSTQCSARLC